MKTRLAAEDPWMPPRPSRRRSPDCFHRPNSRLLAAPRAMRQIKSPAEIALMRRAGRITALAVAEAMRSTAPGLLEGQLGAIAEYIYQLNGASRRRLPADHRLAAPTSGTCTTTATTARSWPANWC